MNSKTDMPLQEPVRKRVGGSLSNLDPLQRLEMLRRNVRALCGDSWKPSDDGDLVRKVVVGRKPGEPK